MGVIESLYHVNFQLMKAHVFKHTRVSQTRWDSLPNRKIGQNIILSEKESSSPLEIHPYWILILSFNSQTD